MAETEKATRNSSVNEYELIKSKTYDDHLLIFFDRNTGSKLRIPFPLPLRIMIFPLFVIFYFPWNCSCFAESTIIFTYICDLPWNPLIMLIGNVIYSMIGAIILGATTKFAALPTTIYILVCIYCIITWIWTFYIIDQIKYPVYRELKQNNLPEKGRAINVDFKNNKNYYEEYKISASIDGFWDIKPNFEVITLTKRLLNTEITEENLREEFVTDDNHYGHTELHLGSFRILKRVGSDEKKRILSLYNHAQNVLLPEYMNYRNPILVFGYIKEIDKQYNQWFVPFEITELILDFYCSEYGQESTIEESGEAQ